MANTFEDYTVSTSTTDFNITFEYLEESHIVVEIDGVLQSTSTYSIVAGPPNLVRLNTPVTSGVVRVRRDSDADSDNPFVDFVNGSVLTETELDKAYRHNLYLNEEIGNLNELSLQKEAGGTNWDAKNNKILNVSDPTLIQDASTKNYVDTQISNTITGSSDVPQKTTFTGTGSATVFTFSSGITLDGDTVYEVAINGVLQEPTAAYTIDADANTITFTSPPALSANIVVVQRGYSVPITTGTVTTELIVNDSVTSDKIASDAVTADAIATGAVGSDAIATGAVTSDEIANDAVTAAAIATDAVTADAIAAGAVGSSELSADSVTSAKISDTDTQFLVDDTSVQKKVVINEAGADVDFRVEGDTDANLIVTDGANDVAGIGGTDSSYKFNVSGNLAVNNNSASQQRNIVIKNDNASPGETSIKFDVPNGQNNVTEGFINFQPSGGGGQMAMTMSDGSGGYKALILKKDGDVSVQGDLSIVGAISKGSGSFKIDHPLKPTTHHLVHSFLEGPTADLIYRGKVELVNGQATVNIDTAAGMTEGTFEVLCTNVQCFTSNESDWDAVKGSVSGNTLSLNCQNTSSNAVVSWLVVGERKDQHMRDTSWTDENGRVIVEPVKVED